MRLAIVIYVPLLAQGLCLDSRLQPALLVGLKHVVSTLFVDYFVVWSRGMMAQAAGDVGSVDDVGNVEQHDIYNRSTRQLEKRLGRIEHKEMSRIDTRVVQLQALVTEHMAIIQNILSAADASTAEGAPSSGALEQGNQQNCRSLFAWPRS